MFRLLVNKNRMFPKIKMYHNGINIGNTTYSVNNNNCVIQNLYIEPQFRKNNFGQFLMLQTEEIVKNDYDNINKFIINAYEKNSGTLVKYYQDIGYNINPKVRQLFHFDGIDIVTITNMIKNVS